MARVDALFLGPRGETIKGRLWDISQSGACLQFNHALNLSENDVGSLVLRHSYSQQELELEAQVCWLSSAPESSLMGVAFASLIKKGTFLDLYFSQAPPH